MPTVSALSESRWTIIRRIRSVKGNHIVLAQCFCGTKREVWESNIRSGKSKSCGCLALELLHLLRLSRRDPSRLSTREYTRFWRRQMKVRAITYMGGKCQGNGCSISFDGTNAVIFDFHHKESILKDFTISRRNVGWEKLVPELQKCLLLCSNCHRLEHKEKF